MLLLRMRLTVLIFVLCAASYAQKVRFTPAQKSVVLERRESVPATVSERQARLEELFKQAGCPERAMSAQKVESASGANVICRLAGKTNEVIIVGANYGLTPPDTWNGAVLLPSLYQALAGRKRHHTFIFVAFADDQRALLGSSFFANHLSQSEQDHTDAMINLDALGFSPTKVSTQHSDSELVKSLIAIVYLLKRSISQVDLSRAVKTDSESFVAKHIPRITLHSLTLEDVTEPRDADPSSIRQFRADNYYGSYYLVSGFLSYLDATLKARRRK